MFRAEVNDTVSASVPPFSVTVFAALPRLASALTLRVPVVIVTLPVKLFDPPSVSVPAPFKISPPAPPITLLSVSVVPVLGLNDPPPTVTDRAKGERPGGHQRAPVERHLVACRHRGRRRRPR